MKIAAYDDDGIWGVGDNEAQARAEAEGFMHECFDGAPDVLQRQIAGLKIAPISDDLLARAEDIDINGGITINQIDAPFHLVDGVLVFDAERKEQEDADAEDEADDSFEDFNEDDGLPRP